MPKIVELYVYIIKNTDNSRCFPMTRFQNAPHSPTLVLCPPKYIYAHLPANKNESLLG